MKEVPVERALTVHTPATCDKLTQFHKSLRVVRYWERWYYANNEPINYHFLMQDPCYPDNKDKRIPLMPVDPNSFRILKKVNQALFDDLCAMGKREDAIEELQYFRKEG